LGDSSSKRFDKDALLHPEYPADHPANMYHVCEGRDNEKYSFLTRWSIRRWEGKWYRMDKEVGPHPITGLLEPLTFCPFCKVNLERDANKRLDYMS